MIQYFHAKEKGYFMLSAEKLIRRGVEDGVFPYAEWALFNRGGVVESGATEGAGGRCFDLASLTKTFTATALLTAVKAGQLALEDDVGELLGRDFLRGMSVFRLLTHTAGLPVWYPF